MSGRGEKTGDGVERGVAKRRGKGKDSGEMVSGRRK